MERNGYNLTRAWFNFKFNNVDKVRAIHSELFMFIVDSWNRYGQKEKFGLPTFHTMELLNIRHRKTFYDRLNELEEWGFIETVSEAKNQEQSRVIKIAACSVNEQASEQPLDQANEQAGEQPAEHIDKQLNNGTKKQGGEASSPCSLQERKEQFRLDVWEAGKDTYSKDMLREFFDYWTEAGKQAKKMKFEKEKAFEIPKRLATWAKRSKEFGRDNNQGGPELEEGDLRGKVM